MMRILGACVFATLLSGCFYGQHSYVERGESNLSMRPPVSDCQFQENALRIENGPATQWILPVRGCQTQSDLQVEIQVEKSWIRLGHVSKADSIQIVVDSVLNWHRDLRDRMCIRLTQPTTNGGRAEIDRAFVYWLNPWIAPVGLATVTAALIIGLTAGQ